MDKDVETVRIFQNKEGFVVEIFYTNNKTATFTIDGFDLSEVFRAIDLQNKRVHRNEIR